MRKLLTSLVLVLMAMNNKINYEKTINLTCLSADGDECRCN